MDLPFAVGVVFLVFVLPFFGLLSRAAKVYLPTFIAVRDAQPRRALAAALYRGLSVAATASTPSLPFGFWEIGVTLGFLGLWGWCYVAFMDAFPRMRVVLMTSPFRDEVQVPVNPETMEPLPAHE